MQSFQLNTEILKIDKNNQQCLTYYYYMSDDNEKSIIIRKEESDGRSEVIDSVTSSPFNGWIQRKVSFDVYESHYKVKTIFENKKH